MTTVGGTSTTTQTSSTSSAVTTTASTTDAKNTDSIKDFQQYLQANIISPRAQQVSEEELFAGSVAETLSALKDTKVSGKYTEELLKQKSAMKRANGSVPYEECAKNALKKLVSDGTLTAEEGDKVYSESFAAAQLDSNTNALYDRTGGVNDPTKAVADLEAALLGARAKLNGFQDGSQKFDTRNLSEKTLSLKDIMGSSSTTATTPTTSGVTSASTPVSGNFSPSGTSFNKEILFKPVANSDGRLAVVSPVVSSQDMISGLELVDSSGNVIEKGRFTSMGDDGSRAKFSFSKPGKSYPKNLTVRITYANGAVQNYEIPDPSKRYN